MLLLFHSRGLHFQSLITFTAKWLWHFLGSFTYIDTLLRETSQSKLFGLPSEKGSTLEGKNLLPIGRKFFPFRVGHFSEGVQCVGKRTGNHKNCLSCKIWWKINKCVKWAVSSGSTLFAKVYVLVLRLKGLTLFCFRQISESRFLPVSLHRRSKGCHDFVLITNAHFFYLFIGFKKSNIFISTHMTSNHSEIGGVCKLDIGITYGFHALTFAGSRGSCLNTRPLGRVFKYLPRDPANVIAMK